MQRQFLTINKTTSLVVSPEESVVLHIRTTSVFLTFLFLVFFFSCLLSVVSGSCLQLNVEGASSPVFLFFAFKSDVGLVEPIILSGIVTATWLQFSGFIF